MVKSYKQSKVLRLSTTEIKDTEKKNKISTS
jgi:hypothetical protein